MLHPSPPKSGLAPKGCFTVKSSGRALQISVGVFLGISGAKLNYAAIFSTGRSLAGDVRLDEAFESSQKDRGEMVD